MKEEVQEEEQDEPRERAASQPAASSAQGAASSAQGAASSAQGAASGRSVWAPAHEGWSGSFLTAGRVKPEPGTVWVERGYQQALNRPLRQHPTLNGADGCTDAVPLQGHDVSVLFLKHLDKW